MEINQHDLNVIRHALGVALWRHKENAAVMKQCADSGGNPMMTINVAIGLERTFLDYVEDISSVQSLLDNAGTLEWTPDDRE